MAKLLSISNDPKTVKGEKRGYLTAVLYLAPYKTSGYQVCPFAEKAGCWRTCLNTAGRGGMPTNGYFDANGVQLPDNAVQRARIWRTRLWKEDRQLFMAQLLNEIDLFVKSARRKDLIPVVRLNGTSDIQWEREPIDPEINPETIFDEFPDITFYDYTKIAKRLYTELPPNYYLALSYSAADPKYQAKCIQAERDGHSLVFVARDNAVKQRLMGEFEGEAVDGDEHDLRFLDPPGARVVLKAKGSARRETNGFVLN